MSSGASLRGMASVSEALPGRDRDDTTQSGSRVSVLWWSNFVGQVNTRPILSQNETFFGRHVHVRATLIKSF